MYPAEEILHERYTPFRASGGKRLPFESADYYELLSPYSRGRIAMVGLQTDEQARENLETLKRFHLEGGVPKTHERAACLERAAARLKSKAEALADLIALEGGKPLKDARIEVARAISSLQWTANEALRLHGTEVAMRGTPAASGHLAFTVREPIGVVLAISAFNHPLNLIAHQVAPAIAAGCPVMVKPALETPLSCWHFLDALYESGLAPEMALPLLAPNEVVEAIARSRDVAFLSFIGSHQVGWHLRSVVAPGTRVTLEHGGSAPVLIDESADLDQAIPILVRGGFYHSGQVCVSVQRIFVHEKRMAEFTQRFVAAVRELKTGDPRLATTDCGPIIRERDLQRIAVTVAEAAAGGAKCLLGGRAAGETCYQPTVLTHAKDGDRVMREEIFGPVVCVNPVSDLEEGIRRANAVDWRFQAAIFTRDIDRAMMAARTLRASAVMINESTTFRVDWMPFRGDGPSGLGTGGISAALHDLAVEKLIVVKTPAFEG